MATRIQLRRDTAANWAAANPLLAPGEAGYDTTNNQLRIGDGTRNWADLPMLDGEGLDLSIYATKVELNAESNARSSADAQHTSQIEALTARLDALEAGGGPGGIGEAPIDGRQYVRSDGAWQALELDSPMLLEFKYKGKDWWPDNVKEGECYAHEQDSQLFFSDIDKNDMDAGAVIDAVVKPGVTLLVSKTSDRSKWAHFTVKTNPVVQTWGRNFEVQLNAQGKDFKRDDDLNVQFNVQVPSGPAVNVEDVAADLAALKRQISSLKGEITKLKKASG